jgi:DNA-binding response OmpR family regulator
VNATSGLDAFVVHMRHELHTPVNAILGYSQLLLEEADGGPLSEASRRDLAHITAAGRQLSRLIGEILDPAGSPDADITDYALRLRHALRTPVISVQGYAEILLDEVEGTPMADDLRRIHSAAGHVADLADAIERLYLAGSSGGDAVTSQAKPAAAFEAAAVRDRPGETGGGGTVLVVDDDESNRTLLTRRLERQGHRVLLACGGHEGLAYAQREAVDVILLDIMMPDLNGYDVLARLKESDGTREIPVLMITGLDDSSSVSRCIALGADDYLAKPFDPLLLRARISSCLSKKRARDFELAYLRGVAAVTTAAAAIEAGTFDPASLDDVGRRPDALGNLARLVRRAAVEVALREQRLRQQVQQLTIEIDERKKAAQVAEITGSDYFRELQKRARGLSSRRSETDRR